MFLESPHLSIAHFSFWIFLSIMHNFVEIRINGCKIKEKNCELLINCLVLKYLNALRYNEKKCWFCYKLVHKSAIKNRQKLRSAPCMTFILIYILLIFIHFCEASERSDEVLYPVHNFHRYINKNMIF